MTHTAGPWVLIDADGERPHIVADHGKKWNNPEICNFYDDVTPSDSVTIGNWYEPTENHKANARLIVAAPELLEALKAFVETMDSLPPSDETSLRVWDRYSDAKDAIKKATA